MTCLALLLLAGSRPVLAVPTGPTRSELAETLARAAALTDMGKLRRGSALVAGLERHVRRGGELLAAARATGDAVASACIEERLERQRSLLRAGEALRNQVAGALARGRDAAAANELALLEVVSQLAEAVSMEAGGCGGVESDRRRVSDVEVTAEGYAPVELYPPGMTSVAAAFDACHPGGACRRSSLVGNDIGEIDWSLIDEPLVNPADPYAYPYAYHYAHEGASESPAEPIAVR